MHQFDLNGRKLVVKNDSGNERDRYGVIIKDARAGGRGDRDMSRDRRRTDRQDNVMRQVMDDDKLGPTWGLSPQFLDSLGIQRPLVNRVFIANVSMLVC